MTCSQALSRRLVAHPPILPLAILGLAKAKNLHSGGDVLDGRIIPPLATSRTWLLLKPEKLLSPPKGVEIGALHCRSRNSPTCATRNLPTCAICGKADASPISPS